MKRRVFRLRARAWLLSATLASVACATDSQPPAAHGTTTGAGMEIGFRAETEPPRAGDNTFEVTVKKDGDPIGDAAVTAVFSMPAMPSMNMPAMRSDVTLATVGDGRYRGTGRLSMVGTWNVVVRVSRGSQELGTKRVSIVAK